ASLSDTAQRVTMRAGTRSRSSARAPWYGPPPAFGGRPGSRSLDMFPRSAITIGGVSSPRATVREPVNARGLWMTRAGAPIAAFLAVLSVAAAAGARPATPSSRTLPHPIATFPVGGHGGAIGFGTKDTSDCGQAGLVCSSVVVPLDRTGAVPGTIT